MLIVPSRPRRSNRLRPGRRGMNPSGSCKCCGEARERRGQLFAPCQQCCTEMSKKGGHLRVNGNGFIPNRVLTLFVQMIVDPKHNFRPGLQKLLGKALLQTGPEFVKVFGRPREGFFFGCQGRVGFHHYAPSSAIFLSGSNPNRGAPAWRASFT